MLYRHTIRLKFNSTSKALPLSAQEDVLRFLSSMSEKWGAKGMEALAPGFFRDRDDSLRPNRLKALQEIRNGKV